MRALLVIAAIAVASVVGLRLYRAPQAAVTKDFDRFGRLVSFPGKTEVPCPKQGPKTEVILAIGQSNAANHAGQRYRSQHGAKVVNLFSGHCFLASSPLLGSSGKMGEPWTLLANQLVSAGASDVVIVSSAIGSTAISEWTSGKLSGLLPEVLDGVTKTGYRPTRVVWIQGESDFLAGTSEREYIDHFKLLLSTLQRSGAPVYVSVSTRGEPYSGWTPDNPVAVAQRALPTLYGVHLVADADQLLTPEDRYDGVHLSVSGQEKLVNSLLQTFGYSALTVAR